ncbi:MAG: ketoacyl-ACP synthase III [Candidatus Eremiobacteraeota bacterium]|nr:ketoacyl-ACP synthase III [Candidatus Eremiobacteraeota bacterium]
MNGRSPAPALFGARIAGIGHYAPEHIVSNADLEKTLDTSDEWIVTRTGMRERRHASADMAVSDLAIRAAEQALKRGGYHATDIDCFILATVTPDFAFPATACIVASHLGATGKPAFDMEIACSGFIYGLSLAAGMIRSGVFTRMMVIGAEKLSGIMNMEDRATAILFGDGAGAAIVERSEQDSFLGCELGADGSTPETLYIPASGSRKPITAAALAAGEQYIHMQGREIFKSAVTRMVNSALVALDRAQLTPSDVRWFVPHQANKRIIDATARQLAMPPERVLMNVDRYGNTSSASIPMVMSEAVDRNLFADGDLLLLSGFGGGLSWGSVLWRWAA